MRDKLQWRCFFLPIGALGQPRPPLWNERERVPAEAGSGRRSQDERVTSAGTAQESQTVQARESRKGANPKEACGIPSYQTMNNNRKQQTLATKSNVALVQMTAAGMTICKQVEQWYVNRKTTPTHVQCNATQVGRSTVLASRK